MTSDLVERLRKRGHYMSTGGGSLFNPDGEEAAAEIERLTRHVEALRMKITDADCGCSYDEPGDVCGMHSPVVALLRTELAKVRTSTIEECAKIAKVGWLTITRSEIGDADQECELCEEIAASIRALLVVKP